MSLKKSSIHTLQGNATEQQIQIVTLQDGENTSQITSHIQIVTLPEKDGLESSMRKIKEKSSFDESDSPGSPDESFAADDEDDDDNPGLDMEVEEIENDSFEDTFEDEVGDEPGPEVFRPGLNKPMVSVLKQPMSKPPETVTVLHGVSKGNQAKMGLKDILAGKRRRQKLPPGCCLCTNKSKCIKCSCATENGCTDQCRAKLCQFKVKYDSMAPMGSTEQNSAAVTGSKTQNQQPHKTPSQKPSQKAASEKRPPQKTPNRDSLQIAPRMKHSPKGRMKIAPKRTPTELAIESLALTRQGQGNAFVSGVPANAPVACTQHIIITMEPDEDALDYALSPAKSPAPYAFSSSPMTSFGGVDKSVLPPSPPSEDGEDSTMHIEIIVMSEDESLHGLTDEDIDEFDEYIVTAEGSSLKEDTPPPPPLPIKTPRKALPKSFKQRSKPKPEPEPREKPVSLIKPKPAPVSLLKSKSQPASLLKPKQSPVSLLKPKSGKNLLKPLVTDQWEDTPKSRKVQKKKKKTKTQLIDMSEKRSKIHDEPFDLEVETAMPEPEEEVDFSQDDVSEDAEPNEPDMDESAEYMWDKMMGKHAKKLSKNKLAKADRQKSETKLENVTNLDTPKVVKDSKSDDIKSKGSIAKKSKTKDSTSEESKVAEPKSKESKPKENKVKEAKPKDSKPKETKLKDSKTKGSKQKDSKASYEFDGNEEDIAETIIIRHQSSPSPPRQSKKGKISIRDIISPKNYFLKKKADSKSKSKRKERSDSVKKLKTHSMGTPVSELPKFTNTKHPTPPMELKFVKVRHCVPKELFKIINNPAVDTPKSAMPKAMTPKSVTQKKVTPKSAMPKAVTPKSVTQKKVTPKITPSENIYSKKYNVGKRYTPRPSSTRAFPLILDENTPTQTGSETPEEETPNSTSLSVTPKERTRKSSPKRPLTPKQATPKSPYVRPLSSRGLAKMRSPPIAKGCITPIKRPITEADLALIPRRHAKISSPAPEARIVDIIETQNKQESTTSQTEKYNMDSTRTKKGKVGPGKKPDTPSVSEKGTDTKKVKVSSGEKFDNSEVLTMMSEVTTHRVNTPKATASKAFTPDATTPTATTSKATTPITAKSKATKPKATTPLLRSVATTPNVISSEATTPVTTDSEMLSPKRKRGRPPKQTTNSTSESPTITSPAKTPTPGRGRGRPRKNANAEPSPKSAESKRKRPFISMHTRPITRRASSDGSTGAPVIDLTEEEQPRKVRTPAASLLKKAVKRLQKTGHKPPSPENTGNKSTSKHKAFPSVNWKTRSTGKSKLHVSMFRNIAKEGLRLSPSLQKRITTENVWQPQVDVEEATFPKHKETQGSATKRPQSRKREQREMSPPRKKPRGEDSTVNTASPKLSTPNPRHTGSTTKSPGSNLKYPVPSNKTMVAAAKSHRVLKSPTPEVKARRAAKSPTPEFKPIVTSVKSLSSTKLPTPDIKSPIRSSRFITIKSPLSSSDAQKSNASRFSSLKSPLGGRKSDSSNTLNEKARGKLKSPVCDKLSQGSRFTGRLSPSVTQTKIAIKTPSQSKETNESKSLEPKIRGRRSSLTKPKEVTKEDTYLIKKRLESKLSELGRFESRESRLKQATHAKTVHSGKSAVTVKSMQNRAASPPKVSSPLLDLMREARTGASDTDNVPSSPKQRPSRLMGTNKKAVSGKFVKRGKISPKISSRRSSSSSGKSSPLPRQSKHFHKGSHSSRVQQSSKNSLQNPKTPVQKSANSRKADKTTPSQKSSKTPTDKSATDSKTSRLSTNGPISPFKLRTDDAPILTDDLIEQALKTRPGAIPRAVGRSRARQLLKKAAARQNESAARIARKMHVLKGGMKKDGGSASSSGTDTKKMSALACGFRIGQRLEAIDKNNPEFTCVASVADLKGDRLRVHFDGWEAGYDFWCRPDSQYIHPVGWCQANAKALSPPQDWTEVATFTWEEYLNRNNASPAPLAAFKRQSKTNRRAHKLASTKPPQQPTSVVMETAPLLTKSNKKTPPRLRCPKRMRCVVEVDRLSDKLFDSACIDLRKVEIASSKRGSGKGKRLEMRQTIQEEPIITPVITGVSTITTEMFHDANIVGEFRPQTRPSQQKDNIFDVFKESVSLASTSTGVLQKDTPTERGIKDNAAAKAQTSEQTSALSSDVSQKTIDSSDSTESIKDKKHKKERRKSADAITDTTERKHKQTKRRLSTSEERDLSESLEHQMSFEEDSSVFTASVAEKSDSVPEQSADLPIDDSAEKASEQQMETETVDDSSNVSSTEKEEQMITSTSSDMEEGVVKESTAGASKDGLQESVTTGETSDSENTVSSTEPNIRENTTDISLETGSTATNNLTQNRIPEKEKPRERNIFEKLSERPHDNTEPLSDKTISCDKAAAESSSQDNEQMDTNDSIPPSGRNETELKEQDLVARFLNKIPAVEKVKEAYLEEDSSDSVSDLADKPQFSGSQSETGLEVSPKDSDMENEKSANETDNSTEPVCIKDLTDISQIAEPVCIKDVTDNSQIADSAVDKTDTVEPVDKSEDNVDSEKSAETSGQLEESVAFADKSEESEQSVTSADQSEDHENSVISNVNVVCVTSADKSQDIVESVASTDKSEDTEQSVISADKSEEQEKRHESGSSEKTVLSADKPESSQQSVSSADKTENQSAEEQGKLAEGSIDEMDTCDIMLLPELAHFLNPPVAERPKLFSVDLIRRRDAGFQCVLCEARLETSALEAVKHITEKHTYCTVCSQTFKEVHVFQQHVDQHAANPDLTAAAKKMEEKTLTSREVTFEARDLISHSEQDCRCLLCGDVFRDESAAGNHVTHFHLKAGP